MKKKLARGKNIRRPNTAMLFGYIICCYLYLYTRWLGSCYIFVVYFVLNKYCVCVFLLFQLMMHMEVLLWSPRVFTFYIYVLMGYEGSLLLHCSKSMGSYVCYYCSSKSTCSWAGYMPLYGLSEAETSSSIGSRETIVGSFYPVDEALSFNLTNFVEGLSS